jgi:hypothetical protein
MRLAALALFFTTTASGVAFAQSVQPTTEQQEPPNGLRHGAWSLTVAPAGFQAAEIPGIGMWYGVSPQVRLGIFGNGNVRSGQDSGARSTDWSAFLAPTVRYALSTASRVVPFWQAGLQVGVDVFPGENGTTVNELDLGVSSGFGVEYFVVPNVTIGGYWGLRYGMVRDPVENAWDYVLRGDGPGAEVSLFF